MACRTSYLYFSERARDTAARNLSIATCISGVKSAGNRRARTTSKLWDRIYKEREKTSRFNKHVVAQDLLVQVKQDVNITEQMKIGLR